jgi:hypothetical protein
MLPGLIFNKKKRMLHRDPATGEGRRWRTGAQCLAAVAPAALCLSRWRPSRRARWLLRADLPAAAVCRRAAAGGGGAHGDHDAEPGRLPHGRLRRAPGARPGGGPVHLHGLQPAAQGGAGGSRQQAASILAALLQLANPAKHRTVACPGLVCPAPHWACLPARPSLLLQVTSSAKKRREPGSTRVAQTPDGSFLDLTRNAWQVGAQGPPSLPCPEAEASAASSSAPQLSLHAASQPVTAVMSAACTRTPGPHLPRPPAAAPAARRSCSAAAWPRCPRWAAWTSTWRAARASSSCTTQRWARSGT